LTGKSLNFGGSPLRPEATGYGLVYMAKMAVEKRLNRNIHGMRCAVSGSGNVAQYASQKLLVLGAKVCTMSDSNGTLVFEDGMTMADWKAIIECKQVKRGRLSSLQEKVSGRYIPNETPWSLDVPYDLALPCATQNEIDRDGAERLINNGVLGIMEGANLPTNIAAQELIREHPDVIYIPGKAANAGGVGVSGFEMSQNAQRLTWTEEEVDNRLEELMEKIYNQMSAEGDTLEQGANMAGFLKVANAMKELGWIY
jgi:glutamate dehydrogenase (NADP+)